MNTKEKKEKSIMEQLRDIRDKLSLEIQDMSPEELKKYLNSKPSLFPNAPWGKKSKVKK
ncbi:MAG TPA: hypothetical protein VK809_01585 [Bacteroidia bacterium]|jgi:hypothetical protein|nr:hypothetical protein [Bacteroidia bacterium]